MAVSTTTSSINYSGTNAANQVCPLPFPFFADSDIAVYLTSSTGTVTTLTQSTAYSVSGAGAPSGGSVTIFTAVAASTTIRIARTLPTTQTTSFTTGDRFPAATMERALDKQTMVAQQVLRGLNRSVRLSDAAPDSNPITPIPNSFFGTDSSGAIALVAGTNAPAGSITNASIATNAAIEGTKIDPNFGTQNVLTTGTITSPSFLGNATTANSIVDGAITNASFAGTVGLNAWTSKTAAYTAVVGDRISANTTSAAFTVTLPASAADYSQVTLADHAGTWKTNNLTVARNGSNINGLAENLVCDVAAKQILLRYEGVTIGWRVYA